MKWSAEDDALLRRERAKGLSYGLIAVWLTYINGAPISRSAVICRAHRIGLCGSVVRPTLVTVARPRPAAKVRVAKARPAKTFTSKAGKAAPVSRAAPARRDTVGKPSPQSSNPSAALKPPAEAPAGGIAFGDSLSWHCRFPIDGRGLSLVFCGAPARQGSSYCAHHHSVTHEPRVLRPIPNARDFSQRPSRASGAERDLVDVIGGDA